MEKADLERIIVDAAVEEGGKQTLSCPQAFKITAEHDVTLKDIGDICNEKGVRLCSCQLGCF